MFMSFSKPFAKGGKTVGALTIKIFQELAILPKLMAKKQSI
jgi:hypothetical protein